LLEAQGTMKNNKANWSNYDQPLLHGILPENTLLIKLIFIDLIDKECSEILSPIAQ
jgi:hypothetical protein